MPIYFIVAGITGYMFGGLHGLVIGVLTFGVFYSVVVSGEA